MVLILPHLTAIFFFNKSNTKWTKNLIVNEFALQKIVITDLLFVVKDTYRK